RFLVMRRSLHLPTGGEGGWRHRDFYRCERSGACVIFVLDAALQRLGSERLVDAASAMTDSMASCIDTTPLGERGHVLGGHPAEVAVLLNDARAALQSDRAFARTCVVRALEL